ncbi:MAG: dihydroneopterin aldolase [Muribaculaceae bacterium]|nr:dihydroneopterin aldolase [Muribaculaceae bacterium]
MEFSGRITLDRIRLHAHHGVTEQERRVGNDYEVTVSVVYPMEMAMKNDILAGTINYAELARVVKHVMSTPSMLLEHVVYRLHRDITERFPAITAGSIKVTKLTPPMRVDLAGVSLSYSW